MSLWMGLALLQLLVLPGRLLVRALRWDEDGPLQTALYTFAASWIVNHLLVIALVLGGLHGRPAWLGVIGVEAALAVWLFRGGARRGPGLGEQVGALLHGPRRASSAWLLAAALAAFGFLLARLPVAAVRVFEKWDAIVSWNRWAEDWAAGLWPAWTMHYPQLVPSGWSVLYVLLGEPVQFASHGVMALFPLATVAIFIDLGLRRRSQAFLLAAPLQAWIGSFGDWVDSGHVDVPVAFFALLALHPLLAAPFGGDRRRDVRRLAAAVFLTAGAALTKQAGIYLVVVMPLLVGLALPGRPLPERLRNAALAAGTLLLVVGPWYGWVEWRIAAGLEWNEAPVTMGSIHGDRGPLERVLASSGHFAEAFSPGLAALAVLLAALALQRRELRRLMLLVVLPFTLGWAALLSYNLRNAAMVMPLWTLAVATGAVIATRALASRIGPGAAGAVWAGVLLAAAWGALPAPDAMRTAQEAQIWELGRPDLNGRLRAQLEGDGFDGPILTDYQHLRNLPGLGVHVFVHRQGDAQTFWPFRAPIQDFVRIVEAPEHGIRFVLATRPMRPAIARYLRSRIEAGDAELLFETRDASLVRMLAPGGGA